MLGQYLLNKKHIEGVMCENLLTQTASIGIMRVSSREVLLIKITQVTDH